MPVNSRQKGAGGERELSKLLRSHGFTEARRGQQYKGTSDSPDVVGIPGLHIECKRVARLGWLYGWLEKAEKEAKVDEDPVIFMRANRGRWLVALDAKDYLDLMAELLEHRRHRPKDGIDRVCGYCGQRCWGTCFEQKAAQRKYEQREGKEHGEAQAPIADHVHLQRGPKPTGESAG